MQREDFALGLNAERTLVQGRVVRIGNAAQTLHPVAGQGLNLGLRDAHALVSALRGTDDLERAPAEVGRARPTAGRDRDHRTSSPARSPGTRRAWARCAPPGWRRCSGCRC
ncbi:MAG: FAD-dependent monooxygenase [Rubrivivax sp.]